MLKIFYGSLPKEIYNTSVYFDNTYQDKWITDDFAVEMIKKIDCSDVVDSGVIKNAVLGSFPPKQLSGGVKTLILIYNEPNKIFNASNCGDNCAKYILKIAEKRDITVCLHHAMDFGKKFSVKLINDNKQTIVTDPLKLLLLADFYLRSDSNAG